MTASVDDKIVQMKIENSQFLRGVEQSLASYSKLESTLNKGFSAKGLDGLNNSTRGFNLNPIEGALSGVSRSWLAMSTVAVTALATIVSRATTAGASLAKSLSLDQVIGGFNEYSTNLNSIQTVLANTQAQGTNLDDVNAALQQLNNYSDKTIYNFGEMAKNIGTFTAAGVSLEGSVSSIKGIANLAALSGSSSEQASTAMYQLSQAIASGRVSLQDWNSVVNAGMGGATFQKALAQTAEAMGTIDKSAINIDKTTGKMTINGASFRDSISAIGGEKWLTSDVLTKTLDQFTGDMTDAQLAAEGFNKEQIAAIQQTAKTAQDAATKVKTIKQVFDVAKETVGSGWAKTFQNIFGDFEEARTNMTDLSNFVGKIIKKQSKQRNEVLASWAHFGGRDAAIDALKNAWQAVLSVVEPIHDAFREIFPATTGFQLAQMTKNVRDFFAGLIVGKSTGEEIKRTFAGLFAIFDIGWKIVSGLFGVVFDLFGAMSGGASSVLGMTANVGDLLVKFDKWLETSGKLESFFDGLGRVLSAPIELIGALASAFASLFGGSDSGGLDATGDALGRVSDRLSPLAGLLDLASDAWHRFLDLLGGGVKLFAPFTAGISKLFGGLGKTIATSMDTGDFSPVLDIINTGLLGAITLLFAKFAKNGFNFNLFGGGGGAISKITAPFEALTGSLEAMQANIQAGTLLKIAGAVALITASVVALSLIDSAALTKAMTALSVGFGQLLGAMAILVKITGVAGIVKMPLMAASLVLLAGAILTLTGAVAILAQLNPEQLTKGLVGVGVLLGFITGFAAATSGSTTSILALGAAMIPLAIGLNLMAAAMIVFATMSWGEMAKGFAGMAGGLLIIAGAMQLMPTTLPITAAGLVLVGIGLTGIAGAMAIFGQMDWKTMGKGMVGIAGALIIIAAAMQLMPATLPLTAAGLVLVGIALTEIAGVAKIFATMSWEEMGKAAAALAGALLIIAGGMQLMSGALPGAAALLIVSAALAVLAPVLVVLGAMSWEAIAKGLVTLAGTFAVLGIAGLLIGPIVPLILGLAAAILIMGAGMALAGAGMLAFSIGLAALAGAGGAGIAVLQQAFIQFIQFLPELATALAVALVAMVTEIAKHAPEMIDAFVAMMAALIDGAIKLVPKFGKLITTMLQTALKVLRANQNAMISAGLDLITSLLEGFAKKIPDMLDAAGDAAAAFIRGMGKQAGKLADAGLDALVDFLNGLADAINSHSGEINAAGARIALAIINGATQGIRDSAHLVWDAAQSVLNGIKDHIKMPHIDVNPFSRAGTDIVGEWVKKLGLVGGEDQIRDGFDTIQNELTAGIEKTNKIIDKDKAALEKLKKQGKGDSKEAEKLRDEIHKQTKAREELLAEQKKWKKNMKDERKDLLDLGHQYDVLQKNIADASAALDKAKADRDSFQSGIKTSFDVKPDITATTSLQSYLREIAKKTAQVKKFTETLQKLREAGLSDESYRQLLAEGVDAQRLMEQLLAGGSDAVNQFNQANAALQSAAGTLASQASLALYYDAAVASAQATLDGWEASQPALEAQMTKIARAMIRAMKKALGIKSPSREFRAVADFATAGLVGGIVGGIGAVEKATEKVGLASLETLKATMNKAGDLGVLDFSPTIAPVLDLTNLQREATKIGTMLATDAIVASASFERALSISQDRTDAANAQAETAAQAAEPRPIELTQINQSPKALDDVTIYRQTKNLISLTKEALEV